MRDVSVRRSALAALEIDLGALRRNAARLRELSAPARFAAVLKANAYGHGLARVARALAYDVDALCVYRAEEAFEIREAGVAAPIIVLGPVDADELAALHAHGVAISLWDSGSYRDDVVAAARRRGTPFAVHAKIETGLTRLGIDPLRAAPALAAYAGEPALRLEGAYTHLAAVEELESSYTLLQLRRFEDALRPVAALLAEQGTKRHAAASAAAMLFPRARLDLVRVGIAAYGLWPSAQTRAALVQPLVLEPVLAWRAPLVLVRDVPAGTPVGYGCTFTTVRPSRIGVLPIGYAEGIPRAVSNRGQVLVGGVRVPIVGRVCMNMTFVDVTDVPDAHAGQAATLIGPDGDAAISADEWADWADTINYEIVARLPAEIPRIYAGA